MRPRSGVKVGLAPSVWVQPAVDILVWLRVRVRASTAMRLPKRRTKGPRHVQGPPAARVKAVVVVWHRVVVPVVNQRHDAAAVIVVRPLQSVAGPEGVRTGGATVVALDRQHALMNGDSTRPPH